MSNKAVIELMSNEAVIDNTNCNLAIMLDLGFWVSLVQVL